MKKYMLFFLLITASSVCFGQDNITAVEPGHVSITEIAYRVTGGIHGSQFVKLNLVNAYRFKSGISLGFGTGFKYAWHGRYIDIPFFADFRGRFNTKKISPYWAFDIAYVFDASNKMKGQGLLVNPSAGVSFRVSDKTSINAGLGYERQGVTQWYFFPDPSDTQMAHYISNSLTLNVGFTF